MIQEEKEIYTRKQNNYLQLLNSIISINLFKVYCITLCDYTIDRHTNERKRRRKLIVKFVAVKVGYPSDQLSWDVKKKQSVGRVQSAYCSHIFIFIQSVIASNDYVFIAFLRRNKKRRGTFHPRLICLSKLKLILERTRLSDSTKDLRHRFGRFP